MITVTIRGWRAHRALRGSSCTSLAGARFPSEIPCARPLPPNGTPTQPVAAGYMANARLRVKHENDDELRRILGIVGQTVKVHAR